MFYKFVYSNNSYDECVSYFNNVTLTVSIIVVQCKFSEMSEPQSKRGNYLSVKYIYVNLNIHI